MPHRPGTQPTDRIMRMLGEIYELEAYYMALEERLATMASASLERRMAMDPIAGLPPRPRFEAIIQERTRQQLNYTKTLYKRKQMQRLRTASELGNAATSFTQIRSQGVGLSAARKAEIDAIVAALPEEMEPPQVSPQEDILAHERQLAAQIGTGEAEIEPDPEAMTPEDLFAGGGFKLT